MSVRVYTEAEAERINNATSIVVNKELAIGSALRALQQSSGGGGGLSAYSPASSYSPGDLVTKNSEVYVCIASSTGNDPAISPQYFKRIGSRGTVTVI